MYLYPELVRKNKIKKNKLSPDCSSKNIISYEKKIKRAWLAKELSKNGIIGNPTNASVAKGRKIVDKVTKCMNKIVNEMYN